MDGVEHVFGVSHHIVVPEPQDSESGRPQELITSSVVRQVLRMLTAIKLDDQPVIQTGKIANVEADLVLPSKLEASELAAAEPAPEKPFSIGRIQSQASGITAHVGIGTEQLGESVASTTTFACVTMTPPSACDADTSPCECRAVRGNGARCQ